GGWGLPVGDGMPSDPLMHSGWARTRRTSASSIIKQTATALGSASSTRCAASSGGTPSLSAISARVLPSYSGLSLTDETKTLSGPASGLRAITARIVLPAVYG